MSREHTPQPGITWETAVRWTETTDPADDGNPLAWVETDPPRPNRATRRALKRARRRTTTEE